MPKKENMIEEINDANHKTNCSHFPSAYCYKPFENSTSSGIKILMSE
jgi:hypothetical protein